MQFRCHQWRSAKSLNVFAKISVIAGGDKVRTVRKRITVFGSEQPEFQIFESAALSLNPSLCSLTSCKAAWSLCVAK